MPHHVRPHYGVVTDRYKLIHFYGPDVDYWELFDRQTDPQELRSVYGEAKYKVAQQKLETELRAVTARSEGASGRSTERFWSAYGRREMIALSGLTTFRNLPS